MSYPHRRPNRLGTVLGAVLGCAVATAALAAGTYGVSLFGELKYGPDFKNFDYINPNAPKGGTMKFSAIGTYDTFNPYVVKGLPAAGIGGIFDTLTVASEDEPGSEYGLAAESIDVAPDRLSVVVGLTLSMLKLAARAFSVFPAASTLQ